MKPIFVVVEKCGDLGNRLALAAQFIASAVEHGAQVWNPAFDEYRPYFQTTSKDVFCRFPPRSLLLSEHQSLNGRAHGAARRLAMAIQRHGPHPRLRTIEFPGQDTSHLISRLMFSLDHPAFIELLRANPIIFFRGYYFYDRTNVVKHAQQIRAYFTPLDRYQDAVSRLVERARAGSDVLVGVHVRHNVARKHWCWENQQYAHIMGKINALFPSRRVSFVVCSDEPVVRADFPQLHVTIGSGHLMEDLYTLARCDYIVGPHSTYSGWASFFGKVPLFCVTDPTAPISIDRFKIISEPYSDLSAIINLQNIDVTKSVLADAYRSPRVPERLRRAAGIDDGASLMIRYPYTGQGVRGFGRFADSNAPEFLVSLYRSMLRIRRIEEEIERRYRDDHMKTPIHLVIGQEATSVGACAAMRETDLLYSSHRTHGNYLAKGGDLKSMLCEMHCRINGCAGSRGGSMHIIDKKVGMAGTSAIVGGAVPIAVGAALAAQMQKADRVVTVFLGDATTEEGVTSESLNFATLKKVPVIFFCENNFYSVQSPLATRQPPREIYKWAAAHGLPSILVDGTNVLAVYTATKEAVGRARAGEGPTFIEARVYRYRAHGGAGDDSRSGYRDEAERGEWERFCPIQMFGEYLVEAGWLKEAMRVDMEADIAAEIASAFEFALASPSPTEEELYRHVYAD